MPDYFLAQHLGTKLGLSSKELLEFEKRGVIKAVSKNGRTFYSSRDFYRLKGVLHFTRNKGLRVEQALEKVMSPAVPSSAAGR